MAQIRATDQIYHILQNEWLKTRLKDEVYLFNELLQSARIVGGEMISLQQVEELAARCFGHTELAAVTVADQRKGERILLYTVQPMDQLVKFRVFLGENKYSSMLCPYRIEIVKSLPLLGSGKIDYMTLKQMAEMTARKGS